MKRLIFSVVLVLVVVLFATGIVNATSEPVRPIDHAAVATAPAVRIHNRLLLIGDSIIWDMCPQFQGIPCYAFPGGWVAGKDGTNLLDGFVTQANPQPGDLVVLSSVSGWHSPGVDDQVISDRLQAAHDRIIATGARLVVLVAPEPNFPNCTSERSPDAIGTTESCPTQEMLENLARSWSDADTITIIGPYLPDQVHPTDETNLILAEQIRSYQ